MQEKGSLAVDYSQVRMCFVVETYLHQKIPNNYQKSIDLLKLLQKLGFIVLLQRKVLIVKNEGKEGIDYKSSACSLLIEVSEWLFTISSHIQCINYLVQVLLVEQIH